MQTALQASPASSPSSVQASSLPAGQVGNALPAQSMAGIFTPKLGWLECVLMSVISWGCQHLLF